MSMRPDRTAVSKIAETSAATSMAARMYGVSGVSVPALAVAWMMRSEIATTSPTRAEVCCSLSFEPRIAAAAVAIDCANSLHWPSTVSVVAASDERVAFCAAVDENGYLPTHNRKFSHPQRPGDPTWNTANCRNRRIFNDRVGLAAGRNTEPFLLQTYRRDMGGGQFVLMKDISAPIIVNGRHWGGLRLAIRV